MATILVVLFAAFTILLWLSTFGWFALLAVMARQRRPSTDRPVNEKTDIAVVIPSLNEEYLIQSKLQDMKRTDYPADRMHVLILDGGSTDKTLDFVAQSIEAGGTVQLVRLTQRQGKSDQINYALLNVTQDVIVFTDVDARLAPTCIGELVSALMRESSMSVVGAVIHPDTPFLEERIYWSFLNTLWWLEGEALGSAGVSGVCYAVRRSSVLPLLPGIHGEDMHLALAAAARGLGVRLCRTAHATEVRVPQTIREFFRFRYRRGHAYLAELLAAARGKWTTKRRLIVCAVRLWHFFVTPLLSIGAVFTGVALVWTPYWPWPLGALLAFIIPAVGIMLAAERLMPTGLPRYALARGVCRLGGLAWLALLWTSLSVRWNRG